jgi:hypothetical protein
MAPDTDRQANQGNHLANFVVSKEYSVVTPEPMKVEKKTKEHECQTQGDCRATSHI